MDILSLKVAVLKKWYDHQAIISKGQILLADDLEGAGHVWSFLKDKSGLMHPWVRCYVHLGEEYEHFISKLK